VRRLHVEIEQVLSEGDPVFEIEFGDGEEVFPVGYTEVIPADWRLPTLRQLTVARAYIVQPPDEEVRASMVCKDCGRNVIAIEEYAYMVTPEVWAQTGLERTGGFLCLEHLEARLGRKTVPQDFPDDIPLNSGTLVPQSPALASRIHPDR
jgi:hypothetical protein